MPTRLSLLTVLLLLSALLFAAGAHGSAPIPSFQALGLEEPREAEGDEEGEEVATECDSAYEEADEGVLSEEEAEQICDEEDTEAQPVAKPPGDKGGNKGEHRVHKHKRTCRHKSPTRRRRCRRQARHPWVR